MCEQSAVGWGQKMEGLNCITKGLYFVQQRVLALWAGKWQGQINVLKNLVALCGRDKDMGEIIRKKILRRLFNQFWHMTRRVWNKIVMVVSEIKEHIALSVISMEALESTGLGGWGVGKDKARMVLCLCNWQCGGATDRNGKFMRGEYFDWGIVVLQCCVSFYCTAKWRSLCYTAGSY